MIYTSLPSILLRSCLCQTSLSATGGRGKGLDCVCVCPRQKYTRTLTHLDRAIFRTLARKISLSPGPSPDSVSYVQFLFVFGMWKKLRFLSGGGGRGRGGGGAVILGSSGIYQRRKSISVEDLSDFLREIRDKGKSITLLYNTGCHKKSPDTFIETCVNF